MKIFHASIVTRYLFQFDVPQPQKCVRQIRQFQNEKKNLGLKIQILKKE